MSREQIPFKVMQNEGIATFGIGAAKEKRIWDQQPLNFTQL